MRTGYYKKLLVEALKAAQHAVLLGGAEFAHEIVGAMNLYRAGKNDAALKAFVDDLRTVIQK